MKAKLIVEAANHPTDPEADEVQLLVLEVLFVITYIF